ncbi:maleylpyruvate isomerase family mycothiol-dependent enzyme [Nonomuraea sp. NPDC049695]|uniref:maleylpyruvate isomerase family mycothiol-dependent enzyme n=1 Tax=Nonomuraea sp. NPDC049695 TaxID=3154734 RepID=UPI003422F6DC
MATLDTARLAEGLREQTAGFARAAAGVDPDTQVPTCPEWPLRTLVGHIGQAHRYATEVLRKGEPQPVPDPWQAAPGAPDKWAEWLRDGADELIGAVQEVGADTEVWTFLGPRPAAFWLRRMLNDTAVHHYDAAVTTGGGFEIADDLAANVIVEGLEMLASPGAEALKPELVQLRGNGERLGLRPHRADGPADGWVIVRTPEGMRWEEGPVEGDVVLSGAVAYVMLVCNRRLALDNDRVTVTGDRALLEHWLAHMAI